MSGTSCLGNSLSNNMLSFVYASVSLRCPGALTSSCRVALIPHIPTCASIVHAYPLSLKLHNYVICLDLCQLLRRDRVASCLGGIKFSITPYSPICSKLPSCTLSHCTQVLFDRLLRKMRQSLINKPRPPAISAERSFTSPLSLYFTIAANPVPVCGGLTY